MKLVESSLQKTSPHHLHCYTNIKSWGKVSWNCQCKLYQTDKYSLTNCVKLVLMLISTSSMLLRQLVTVWSASWRHCNNDDNNLMTCGEKERSFWNNVSRGARLMRKWERFKFHLWLSGFLYNVTFLVRMVVRGRERRIELSFESWVEFRNSRVTVNLPLSGTVDDDTTGILPVF